MAQCHDATDAAMDDDRLVFFRCDSIAEASNVLGSGVGLHPHPGVAVAPLELWILLIMAIDHVLGSGALRLRNLGRAGTSSVVGRHRHAASAWTRCDVAGAIRQASRASRRPPLEWR